MIFKDKTVIITGGSEGVGAAAARLFAEAGANLLLVARSKKKLEVIAEELREVTKVEIFAMDVSDADACVDLFKKANFEFGRVDVLINNAGFHERGPVETVDVADLGKMVDVNLINVGSLAGRLPVPNSATYAASKAGLRSFTYSLANEFSDNKIKIAVVSPGPIDTGFIMANIDNTSDLTFSQPMSTAEEVAQVILDLCGNKQREISMPRISGLLTTLMYLMPWLGRTIRPLFERRGARIKARLKAKK